MYTTRTLRERVLPLMFLGMAGPKTRKRAQQLSIIQAALNEGRFADAWADAQRLLALRVKDVQLLNLGGIAAYQSGDIQAAIELLLQASTRRPDDPEIAMNLANVQAGTGDIDAALASYKMAHDANNRFAEPAYNAGIMLNSNGDHIGAADWFTHALERNPEHIQAAIGKADAFKQLGDYDGATATLSVLLGLDPDNAAVHTNLSAIAMDIGYVAEAYDAATKAIKCDPGMSAAHYNLGVATQAKSDHAEAVEHYRKSLALDAGNAAAALNQGEAYLALNDEAGARSAFQRAIDIDPTFAKAVINLADLDLISANPGAALQKIDAFLDDVPGHPSALAFKAIALRDLGNVEAACELDDLDRFVMPLTIDAPEGFADICAFNQAMAAHVMSHPTLTSSPTAHATRQGFHSGELLSAPRGPFDPFHQIIIDAFQRYRRQFIGEAANPFLDQCPETFEVSVWGVVMNESGHQVPHIHPAAWLSGVYYVEVPSSINDDAMEHAGWIEFGRPPDDIHAQHVPVTKLFQPEAGKMLLFPSHFYHRTLPLSGDQRRISVAFDIMPTG